VREKNEYDHTEFHDLQREFGIPNWAQGRTVSVHFYYGKLLGALNNVVRARDSFHINSGDEAKLEEYKRYRRTLDPNCPKLRDFDTATENLDHIAKKSNEMETTFLNGFAAMEVANAPMREWISVRTYNELQLCVSNPAAATSSRNSLLAFAKREFLSYYSCKYRHVIIDFMVKLVHIGAVFINRNFLRGKTTSTIQLRIVVGHAIRLNIL
jgi:hypothetical protein